MDQSFEELPEPKKEEKPMEKEFPEPKKEEKPMEKEFPEPKKVEKPMEKEHPASKKNNNPTSLLWGFKTREVRITKIPNHFQAKKAENILILVAFSIGLGSMWRFPYLCHQNGGGSFLLMYLILLLMLGIPLMYMEMVVGQWLRKDNIQAWKYLVPWLSGVGYSSILASVLVILYNSALVSWSLFYLVQSFDYPLSWDHCPLVENFSIVDFSCLWIEPHQYFWYQTVLRASNQIEEGIEVLALNVTLCLCATWIFLYVTMVIRIKISVLTRGENNIKWASFVAMVNLVTSLLSSSVTFLVLGFWATTTGSKCLERSVSNLLNLITNGVLPQAAWPPKDIIHKSPQEYLDWISQLPIDLQNEILHLTLPCSLLREEGKFMEGPGLPYVAFSQAISLFPGSSFWAIIFFMSLAIMGLGTMITLLEGVVLPLQKSISIFTKHPNLVPVLVCLGGLLGSLVFSSRPGSYVVFLFDDHLVPMILIIIMVIQNLSLAWVYGIKRFRAEMFGQLGHMVWAPFTCLWSYVTLPMLLALLTIYFLNLCHSESLYYVSWNNSMSQEVKRPYQKIALGWVIFLSILGLLPIPMYPLQHWWYLDDQNICETLEKPLSSRKTVTVPNRVTQWPVHPMRKRTLRNQEKSKALFQSKDPPDALLQPQVLITKKDSEVYSSFSFPGITIASHPGSMAFIVPGASKHTGLQEGDLD
ncbi:orphan sodium- and chloride-dependent neurotransmitter transporter NTT5-like isoform X4 [Arvicanthis niloticus]|uniref:orphan sodium- and chloride-dependent neurotransmitter transporter NTT5-like isoform X5 n=1 Tax=Arvicanthis niloticus TaxID=61156 RepID=UPI00402B5B3F